jgi:ATP-dependent DNA helicase RecG
MARFMGKDKLGNYIDNQQVSGHVFYLLSEADAFLRRHLSIASFFKIDQWRRIDQPTLPVLAVREALINAICHRDYADESTNVTLAIFDDRIEIWNSGRLPPTLTIADLKKNHDSFPRNKLIAHVLYACGLIEAWGTGTNKMIELCKAAHVPPPLFKERSGGLLVTFRFKRSLGTSYAVPSKALVLAKRQREILEIIRHHKGANVHLIQSTLEPPASKRVIQLDLKVLEKAGFIQLRGRAQLVTWILIQGTRDLDEPS